MTADQQAALRQDGTAAKPPTRPWVPEPIPAHKPEYVDPGRTHAAYVGAMMLVVLVIAVIGVIALTGNDPPERPYVSTAPIERAQGAAVVPTIGQPQTPPVSSSPSEASKVAETLVPLGLKASSELVPPPKVFKDAQSLVDTFCATPVWLAQADGYSIGFLSKGTPRDAVTWAQLYIPQESQQDADWEFPTLPTFTACHDALGKPSYLLVYEGVATLRSGKKWKVPIVIWLYTDDDMMRVRAIKFGDPYW